MIHAKIQHLIALSKQPQFAVINAAVKEAARRFGAEPTEKNSDRLVELARYKAEMMEAAYAGRE